MEWRWIPIECDRRKSSITGRRCFWPGRAWLSEQHEGLAEKVGSTPELTTLTLDGLKIRKQLLPLVRNKFKGDSGILAEWETATYIVRAARSKVEPEKPVA